MRTARLAMGAFLRCSAASAVVALWFAFFLGLPHGLDAGRTALFAGVMCWPAIVCAAVGAVAAGIAPRSGRWVALTLGVCCVALAVVHEEAHGLSKCAGFLSLLAAGGGGVAGFRAAQRVALAVGGSPDAEPGAAADRGRM